MTADTVLELRQLVKVLRMWRPSPPEEAQALTPFLFEIKELVMEYAKRIVARQRVKALRQGLPSSGSAEEGN